MNSFVFISTNKVEYLNQTIFSILSLIRFKENKNAKIYIFSDKIDYFKKFFSGHDLNIEYILYDEDLKTQWTAPCPNVFRVKLMIFKEIWSRDPKANIIFFDSDTVIKSSFNKWFDYLDKENNTLMNYDEGNMKRGATYGLKKAYRDLSFHDIRIKGQNFKIPDTLNMFNAGVIGIGHKSKDLLSKSLDFHDDFYNSCRHYNSEQIALSYIFSHQGNLETCDNDLDHYWYLKEFGDVINKFVSSIYDSTWIEKTQQQLPIQKLPTRREFKSLPFKLRFKFNKKLHRLGLKKSYISFE